MTKPTASSIIQQKLMDEGGHSRVYSLTGKEYDVFLSKDGTEFYSKDLGRPPCRLEIFDIVYDFLVKEGGSVLKGSGRDSGMRVGYGKCTEHTLRGIVEIEYLHKPAGAPAGPDINHVLAAVLEWAGIARNERGRITLM